MTQAQLADCLPHTQPVHQFPRVPNCCSAGARERPNTDTDRLSRIVLVEPLLPGRGKRPHQQMEIAPVAWRWEPAALEVGPERASLIGIERRRNRGCRARAETGVKVAQQPGVVRDPASCDSESNRLYQCVRGRRGDRDPSRIAQHQWEHALEVRRWGTKHTQWRPGTGPPGFGKRDQVAPIGQCAASVTRMEPTGSSLVCDSKGKGEPDSAPGRRASSDIGWPQGYRCRPTDNAPRLRSCLPQYPDPSSAG